MTSGPAGEERAGREGWRPDCVAGVTDA